MKFEFNGESSDKYGVVITKIEDSNFGISREVLKGEKTKYRPRSNHYGAKYDGDLTFTMSVIKDSLCKTGDTNDMKFLTSDTRKINSWLTSPQYPKSLKIINPQYYNEYIEYFAIINDVTAESKGYVYELTYKVECDSPYGWSQEYVHNVSATAAMPSTIIINNNSDELEDYVYPIFTIVPNTETEITIENITDERSITFKGLKDNTIILDSQHRKFMDETKELLSLSDMGISDVDKIFFPRLCSGKNEIRITGNVDVAISYREPRKVGAF